MCEKTAALRGRFLRVARSGGVWFQDVERGREIMLRVDGVPRELALACLLQDDATAEVVVGTDGAVSTDYFGAGAVRGYETRSDYSLAYRIHEYVRRQSTPEKVTAAIEEWAGRHEYMVFRTFSQSDLLHAVAVTLWFDQSATVVRHSRNPSTGALEEQSMLPPLSRLDAVPEATAGHAALRLHTAGTNLVVAADAMRSAAGESGYEEHQYALMGAAKPAAVLGAALADHLSARYVAMENST